MKDKTRFNISEYHIPISLVDYPYQYIKTTICGEDVNIQIECCINKESGRFELSGEEAKKAGFSQKLIKRLFT